MNKSLTLSIKILFIAILSFFIVYNPTKQIFAQEKTGSESGTLDQQEETIQDIKKIIKENIENNKVKGAISNLLNRKIAMIGQVSRITDDTITIKNLDGTVILPLDDVPKIIKDKKQIDVDKVEVENWVMVLGKLKDDNFSPKFIYVFSKTLRPKKQTVVLGTIMSISNSKLVITPRSGGEEITLKLTSNTEYLDSDSEPVTANDFSEDINILVTGFGNESITASKLKSLAPLSDE